jgi:hypothetical protein
VQDEDDAGISDRPDDMADSTCNGLVLRTHETKVQLDIVKQKINVNLKNQKTKQKA